jgi:transcriptional regulator with XRE-family HTH domain
MRIGIMVQAILCGPALADSPARYYRRDVPNDLSSRIHAARRALGKNQAEFAKALGVNQATVSRWERGSHPDGVILAKIAKLAAIAAVKIKHNVLRMVGLLTPWLCRKARKEKCINA